MFTGSMSRSLVISVVNCDHGTVVVGRSYCRCAQPRRVKFSNDMLCDISDDTDKASYQLSAGQFQACPFRANAWLTATLNC